MVTMCSSDAHITACNPMLCPNWGLQSDVVSELGLQALTNVALMLALYGNFDIIWSRSCFERSNAVVPHTRRGMWCCDGAVTVL